VRNISSISRHVFDDSWEVFRRGTTLDLRTCVWNNLVPGHQQDLFARLQSREALIDAIHPRWDLDALLRHLDARDTIRTTVVHQVKAHWSS
jgi:hypothetical protein